MADSAGKAGRRGRQHAEQVGAPDPSRQTRSASVLLFMSHPPEKKHALQPQILHTFSSLLQNGVAPLSSHHAKPTLLCTNRPFSPVDAVPANTVLYSCTPRGGFSPSSLSSAPTALLRYRMLNTQQGEREGFTNPCRDGDPHEHSLAPSPGEPADLGSINTPGASSTLCAQPTAPSSASAGMCFANRSISFLFNVAS